MAKYTTAQLQALGKAGKAFKNPDGSYSYPVGDLEDLKNAIHAVGRGGASHGAIRKFIAGRARVMGQAKLIPPTWASDGSLKSAPSRSSDHLLEVRRNLRGSLETRTYTAAIELRDDVGGHHVAVEGMPIRYDVGYQVNDKWGRFTERMHRGVATDLLGKGVDCCLLVNHDASAIPLARTTAGNLRFTDTDEGLTFRGEIDTRQSLAADLAVAIENKVIRQMSVGMMIAEDKWNASQTERDVYRLSGLPDISAVTFPASTETSIALAERSAGHRMTTQELRADIERERRERTARAPYERRLRQRDQLASLRREIDRLDKSIASLRGQR